MIFLTERIRSLVEFENRAHRVFIHYTHGSIKNWFNVLYKGDLSTLAESVQKFVSDCPVAGLILHGIEPPRPIVSTVPSTSRYLLNVHP